MALRIHRFTFRHHHHDIHITGVCYISYYFMHHRQSVAAMANKPAEPSRVHHTRAAYTMPFSCASARERCARLAMRGGELAAVRRFCVATAAIATVMRGGASGEQLAAITVRAGWSPITAARRRASITLRSAGDRTKQVRRNATSTARARAAKRGGASAAWQSKASWRECTRVYRRANAANAAAAPAAGAIWRASWVGITCINIAKHHQWRASAQAALPIAISGLAACWQAPASSRSARWRRCGRGSNRKQIKRRKQRRAAGGSSKCGSRTKQQQVAVAGAEYKAAGGGNGGVGGVAGAGKRGASAGEARRRNEAAGGRYRPAGKAVAFTGVYRAAWLAANARQ